MLAMFCFCTLNLSNSFLSNCQFPFCQATQFCSAKQNIFAREGPRPPQPPPRNAYVYILNPILRGYERETSDIVKSLSSKMFISDVSNLGLILERSHQDSPAAYFWILICWKFAQVLKNSWNVKLENVNSWSRPEFNLVSIPGYSCCPVYWLFLAHCYYHQGRQWCFPVFRI